MLKEFQHFVEVNEFFRQGEKVLLAVSGGIDSMVLFHLFHKFRFDFTVAHVNFQLRGTESLGDEDFVRNTCERHGIPFITTRFDTKNYATQQRLSIQMAARELRYQWFRQLLADHSFAAVATAHHRDDMVETMLMNLLHGRSLDGLTGIPVKRKGVVRPLLFADRVQIERYAADEGITWREDESNSTSDYERNFLRHRVLPLLKELNPSLLETWTRTTEKARLESALLTEVLHAWKTRHLRNEAGTWRIAKEILSEGKFNELYLSYALQEFGFNHSQCASLAEAATMQTGKMIVSTTHSLVVDRHEIIISEIPSALPEVVIQKGQWESNNGFASLHFELARELSRPSPPQMAVIDFEKVAFPLTWRPWREGDRFQPLGMTGSKKISDFLIDQKLPRTEKEKVTVLESAGNIIWVVGHRIDHRVRVQADTRSALVIREVLLK